MRAALLARPGDACERLAAALRDAGADVVLVGDPRSLDPDALRDCAPQAVLVALEPAVEDSLDRFDAVLHDPTVMVIFDEADLAARREGWDAARWGRHLRAKLHGHDDVLPAGAAAWTTATAATDFADGDGVDASVIEMMASFDDAPRDAGADTTVRLDDSPLELEWTADGAADDDAPVGGGGVVLVGADDLLDAVADADDISTLAIDSTPLDLDWSADRDGRRTDDTITIGSLSLVDGDDLIHSLADAPATPGADVHALDPDVQAMLDSLPEAGNDAPAATTFDADVLAMLDAAPSDRRTETDAAPTVADIAPSTHAPTSAAPRVAAPVFDLDGMSLDAMDDATDAASDRDRDAAAPHASAAAKSTPDFSRFDIGLSLADADAAPLAGTAVDADAPGAAKAVDLDALDRRASTLSLVETADAEGTDVAVHGAVVVDAGLGGPDAVRQLLGGLPSDFPRALLVRLALDGGRYDRLVKQMERASALRVSIAEAGAAVMAGTVYFLPDDVGLVRRADGFAFVTRDIVDGSWMEALPANDSALLLLSGSDAGRVDRALQMAADGALVAGQAQQDCYDSRAASALIARGAASGTPAELAARLVARWPA